MRSSADASRVEKAEITEQRIGRRLRADVARPWCTRQDRDIEDPFAGHAFAIGASLRRHSRRR
jgi:hypothetical protein